MMKKEINQILDNMSYEQQLEVFKQLTDRDTQAYDDSWDIITPVVDAVIDCIKVIAKIFK